MDDVEYNDGDYEIMKTQIAVFLNIPEFRRTRLIEEYKPYEKAMAIFNGMTPLDKSNIDIGETECIYYEVTYTNEPIQISIGHPIRDIDDDIDDNNHSVVYSNIDGNEVVVPNKGPPNYNVYILKDYLMKLKHNPELLVYILCSSTQRKHYPALTLLKKCIEDKFKLTIPKNTSSLTNDFIGEDVDEEEEEGGGGVTGSKNSSKKTKHNRNRKHAKKNKTNRIKKTKKTKKTKRIKRMKRTKMNKK